MLLINKYFLFSLSTVGIFHVHVHIPMFTHNAEHDMKTNLGTLKAITSSHLTFDFFHFLNYAERDFILKGRFVQHIGIYQGFNV